MLWLNWKKQQQKAQKNFKWLFFISLYIFEIFKIIKFICQDFCDQKGDGRVEGEDEWLLPLKGIFLYHIGLLSI